MQLESSVFGVLFVKYQVPSDLLSYDGVKAVMYVIEGEKVKQLEEKTMEADLAVEAQLADSFGFGGGGGGMDSVPQCARLNKKKLKSKKKSDASLRRKSGSALPDVPGAMMAALRCEVVRGKPSVFCFESK